MKAKHEILKLEYEKWKTEDLIRGINKKDYLPFAIDLMKEELQRRSVSDKNIDKLWKTFLQEEEILETSGELYCPNCHSKKIGDKSRLWYIMIIAPIEYFLRSKYQCLECGHEFKKRRETTEIITKANKYKRLNWIAASVVMGAIFCLYIVSASRARESDNVGIIVVPFILLTIWGPAVSFACGLIETRKIRQSSNSGDKGYFSVFMSTQPFLFKVSGGIGLVLLIFGILKLGLKEFLEIPLFPFWALKYLF